MNCFDCAGQGATTAAVAVCCECGAAVCTAHATVESHHLTRTVTTGLRVPVEPPARLIRCGACDAARQAVAREERDHGGHPIHNPFHNPFHRHDSGPTDA